MAKHKHPQYECLSEAARQTGIPKATLARYAKKKKIFSKRTGHVLMLNMRQVRSLSTPVRGKPLGYRDPNAKCRQPKKPERKPRSPNKLKYGSHILAVIDETPTPKGPIQ